MPRRFAVVLLMLLAVPLGALAQDVPEKLLPAGTQVFLRWDGLEAHRADYEKLALGKMLQGDTGKFVLNAYDQLQELLGSAVVGELLQGTPPEKLQKIQADAKETPKLVQVLGEHGIILGIEASSLEPPTVQAFLILPDAGPKASPLFAALRLMASLGRLDIKETKIDNRSVMSFQGAEVPHGWWIEGKHVVFTAGTMKLSDVIGRMTKGPNLTENALFKKVQGFKEFKTGARAFVDIASLVKLGGSRGKEVAQILTDLGVDGLKNLTFQSGFDGPAEHGIMDLEMDGPPRGVMSLLAGKPFKLSDLPPLPDDVTTWSMTNLDGKIAYDEALSAVEKIVKLTSPEDLPKIKEALKEIDNGLGVNLRKDLLAHLGDKVVQYSSSVEGPLFFGQVIMVQVADAAKLQAGIDGAIKGLSKKSGVEVTQKKRTYHGVEMTEVHVKQQGFIFVPSYVIHKGWLAVSFYPQAVQGFILRSNGELPAWKPDATTTASLAKMPKEFLSISVSDPRPSLKQLLSLAPLIGGAVNSFVPQSTLDVGAIPNAYEATKHLFPNVAVATLKGNTLRLESRSSFALPLDLGNSESIIALQAFSLVVFGFAGK